MAIINPTEEIEILTENIDMLETQIEELEAGGELDTVDSEVLRIYTAINDLQVELLDFLESNADTAAGTAPPA